MHVVFVFVCSVAVCCICNLKASTCMLFVCRRENITCDRYGSISVYDSHFDENVVLFLPPL